MMYLEEFWMFSVHAASHVTVLSARTSFHWWPAGGSGILESLQQSRGGYSSKFLILKYKQLRVTSPHVTCSHTPMQVWLQAPSSSDQNSGQLICACVHGHAPPHPPRSDQNRKLCAENSEAPAHIPGRCCTPLSLGSLEFEGLHRTSSR